MLQPWQCPWKWLKANTSNTRATLSRGGKAIEKHVAFLHTPVPAALTKAHLTAPLAPRQTLKAKIWKAIVWLS